VRLDYYEWWLKLDFCVVFGGKDTNGIGD